MSLNKRSETPPRERASFFKAGDFRGALGELAVTPAGQQALGNFISQFELTDPTRQGQQSFETEAKRRQAIIANPIPGDIKDVELSGPIQEALVRGEKAISDFRELTSLATQLIDEDKVGFFKGQFTQIKNFLGLSDPNSARFIGLRKLMTVGIAARENEGRPSKEDQKAIGDFIAGVPMNPAALYEVLNMGLAKQQRDVAKQFLIFRGLTTNLTKKRLIEETALRSGVNLKDLDAADRISAKLKKRQIKATGTRKKNFTPAHILGIRNMFNQLTPETAKRLTPKQRARMNLIFPFLKEEKLL